MSHVSVCFLVFFECISESIAPYSICFIFACFVSEQGGYVLFCYNIGRDATENTLWRLFSPFGPIMKVNVAMDLSKGVSKGYGFVTMCNAEEAQNAVDNLHGFQFEGRSLQVSFKKT